MFVKFSFYYLTENSVVCPARKNNLVTQKTECESHEL